MSSGPPKKRRDEPAGAAPSPHALPRPGRARRHLAERPRRRIRRPPRPSPPFSPGSLDRPPAQLDYYPTSGSFPLVYALADRGARLLIEQDGIDFANVEWSRKNRDAGRPFIEHQLEIVDFYVALQRSTIDRDNARVIHPDEIIATFPDQTFSERNPFALRVNIPHQGTIHEIAVVPAPVSALQSPDGPRLCLWAGTDASHPPLL
mgnify:CR=1 FL=1